MPTVFPSGRPLYGRFGILAVCALLVAACTYEYGRHKTEHLLRQSHLMTDYQVSRSDSWVLSGEASVCLVTPAQDQPLVSWDARPRAHQQLNQALYKALAQHFVVAQVPQVNQLPAAAQASALRGCSVMMVPHILDAQDQLNSWAEVDQDLSVFPHRRPGPDNVVVRIAMYSVVGLNPLDIATVHSRTGVWTLNERIPSDMFDKAMRAYVASISNKRHAG